MLRRRPRYTLFPYTTLFRSNQQRKQVAKQTKAATDTLVLNEELTRILIDQQLQEAGWEADSQDITFQNGARPEDRKSTRLNSSHVRISYAVFCLKKKTHTTT